jgi:hypothetical protein
LPDRRKRSIITVPIYKGDKTDCSNYRGISLLSTSYKILSNILLSRLSPYVDEIVGDHQCVFRRNTSNTDQIFFFCIRQILEEKKNGRTLRQCNHIFIDFKKAYDSVSWGVLYNFPVEFGVPVKLVRLIKMSLNETYSKVCIGKHLSDMLPVHNGLERDAFSPLLFKFAFRICH